MPPLRPLVGVGLIAREYRTTGTNLTLEFWKFFRGGSLRDLNAGWVEP
jgi:hypothetical protein